MAIEFSERGELNVTAENIAVERQRLASRAGKVDVRYRSSHRAKGTRELGRLRLAEWVGNAAAESKQDCAGQHRGERATPPHGVGRGLQQKSTDRGSEGQ